MDRLEFRRKCYEELYGTKIDESFICAGLKPKFVYGACYYCANFDMETRLCPAFPNGIPDRIAYGEDWHEAVAKDQVGKVVFSRLI